MAKKLRSIFEGVSENSCAAFADDRNRIFHEKP